MVNADITTVSDVNGDGQEERGPHAAFIDALGGTAAVAKLLQQHWGEAGPSSQAVSTYKRKGSEIPWRHRNALASEALSRGVPIPNGFLGV